MNIEVLLGVLALVLLPTLAGLGAWRVAVRTAGMTPGPRMGKVLHVVKTSIAQIGGVATAAIVMLAGLAMTVAVGWVLGKGAHAIQGVVDKPVFRWTEHHQTKAWTDVWWTLTNIGSPANTQHAVVVCAVVLALLWRKRLWWLPGAALVIGYVFEKYGQIILKTVVHRGHPPFCARIDCVTFGTWPSGGCARVIVIYGLIAYFLARAYKSGRSNRAWCLAAVVVSLALTIQAYARLNNLEHWFTDVVGGCIYGTMLLTLMVGGAEIVQRGVRRVDPDPGGRFAHAPRETSAPKRGAVPMEGS